MVSLALSCMRESAHNLRRYTQSYLICSHWRMRYLIICSTSSIHRFRSEQVSSGVLVVPHTTASPAVLGASALRSRSSTGFTDLRATTLKRPCPLLFTVAFDDHDRHRNPSPCTCLSLRYIPSGGRGPQQRLPHRRLRDKSAGTCWPSYLRAALTRCFPGK